MSARTIPAYAKANMEISYNFTCTLCSAAHMIMILVMKLSCTIKQARETLSMKIRDICHALAYIVRETTLRIAGRVLRNVGGVKWQPFLSW